MVLIGHADLNRALVDLVTGLSPKQALALTEDQQSPFRLADGFDDIAEPELWRDPSRHRTDGGLTQILKL